MLPEAWRGVKKAEVEGCGYLNGCRAGKVHRGREGRWWAVQKSRSQCVFRRFPPPRLGLVVFTFGLVGVQETGRRNFLGAEKRLKSRVFQFAGGLSWGRSLPGDRRSTRPISGFGAIHTPAEGFCGVGSRIVRVRLVRLFRLSRRDGPGPYPAAKSCPVTSQGSQWLSAGGPKSAYVFSPSRNALRRFPVRADRPKPLRSA